MNALLYFALIYGLFGVIYLLLASKRILKQNGMRIFDYSKIWYAFVFGFLPMLIYFREYKGERNLFFTDYTKLEFGKMVLLLLFSLIVYACLNFGYGVIKKKKYESVVNDDTRQENVSETETGRLLFVTGLILLVIAWISLYLWTRAYGSITSFILNAAAIRSGKSNITNRLAFMKHFVRLMNVALYALLSGYLYEKPKSWKKLFYIVFLIAAVIGNYYYLLASDSRITIVYTCFSCLSIAMRHRKRKNLFQYVIVYVPAVLVIFAVTVYADSFLRYLRYGEWIAKRADFISLIIREFRFSVSSEMRALTAWFEGILKWQIGNDIINSLFCWIPDRFIPFSLPNTVWAYNTNIYASYSSGTAPSNLLATGIYELGLIGIVLYPFLWGMILGYIDRNIWSIPNNRFREVYYGIFLNIAITQISSSELSAFALALFPAFVFYLISGFVEKTMYKRKRNVSGEETAA